jgi:hypothetical protein
MLPINQKRIKIDVKSVQILKRLKFKEQLKYPNANN